MTKNWKKLQLKKKLIYFGSKTTIYISLGLHKERPSTEEAFSSPKRPSKSGFRIRIHWPDWIRIQSGSGSATLRSQLIKLCKFKSALYLTWRRMSWAHWQWPAAGMMFHPWRPQRRSGCAAARQGASSEQTSEKGAGTRSAAADWSAETESAAADWSAESESAAADWSAETESAAADWSAETESAAISVAVERPAGEPVDTSREVASAGSTPTP
jgi:hypothetical protein